MRRVVILLMFASATSTAKPVVTVTCAEPIGSRYDLQDGVVRAQADRFSGVRPVFILDDDKPKVLTFIWGPADWAKRELGVQQSAQEAIIVSVTAEKITAIRTEEQGVTQMYSLYPSSGLVFFTQHRYVALAGGVPTASTFHSKCTFSYN